MHKQALIDHPLDLNKQYVLTLLISRYEDNSTNVSLLEGPDKEELLNCFLSLTDGKGESILSELIDGLLMIV